MSPVQLIWSKPSCKAQWEEDKADRKKKRWEDNIREWAGLEFAKSQRAVEKSGEQRKMEETGHEVICGAPTTPAI